VDDERNASNTCGTICFKGQRTMRNGNTEHVKTAKSSEEMQAWRLMWYVDVHTIIFLVFE